MSKSSRGQKCDCGHARIKHNPNAGSCLLCECGFFKAVKYRQTRVKETQPKVSR